MAEQTTTEPNLVPPDPLAEGLAPYAADDFYGGTIDYPASVTDDDGVVMGVRTFIHDDGTPIVQIIVDDPIDLRAIVNLTPEQWEAIRSFWPEQGA